jgi:hypothetical protein
MHVSVHTPLYDHTQGQFERTQRYIGYLRTAIADHKEEFVVRPHAYYMLYALLNASARLMPEGEREAAKEEAQAALLQAAQWWHGRALAELYRQYACMDEKKRDVRKAAKYYRAAQQAGWVYVEPRCEILTHPASIARYQARELSKQDSDELSDLEEDELAEKDPTMVNASRM